MRQGRRPVFALDCPFLAWCAQQRQEFALRKERAPTPPPKVLPFTFNDVPSALADDEKQVVLKPFGGVKS